MGLNISSRISAYIKTITIEPVIFLFIVGTYILMGSQIPTNILIYKICHIELNYTEEVCEHLGDDSNRDTEEEVQVLVNNFQMKANWIVAVPGIFFSLYAGPLSDRFGRKPVLMIPILGTALQAFGGLINYIFLDSLPLEFFYIETISTFFGGMVVYYLGVYGYGASVSEPEERAHRIARLDGTEYLATLIGTLLSPHVPTFLGYYGSYSLFGGLSLLAALYLHIFVKEPIIKDSTNKETFKAKKFLYSAFVTPLIDMKSLLTKNRKPILIILITLQLIVYCNYIFVYNTVNSLMYLFMNIQFDGFDSEDFAYYSVSMNVCSIVLLVIVMPIASGKFHLSDALLLLLISFVDTLGFALAPFTSNLAMFYVYQLLCQIGNCKFPIGRSLLSKCCEADEVGKMFALLSILLSVTFMISNPIVRQLYNYTIGTFPGAFLLLNASLLLVSGFANFFVYIKEKTIPCEESQQKEVQKETANPDIIENK